MGYKFISYIKANQYNTKRFYLDDGAKDLPPIVDRYDIMPGSEALDLKSLKMWVLNSDFQWKETPWRESGTRASVPDIPLDKKDTRYIRYANPEGVAEWKQADFVEEAPQGKSGVVYVRKDNGDGTFKWVEGLENAPIVSEETIYAIETVKNETTGQLENKWVPFEASEIKAYNTDEWKALDVKPDYTEIKDSVFDGTITGNMYIDK